MDCSKYNIDVRALFLSLIPYFWLITPETKAEKTKFKNYLEVISGSLEETQSELYALCNILNDFLNVTGQHLSLENYLNNLYDNIQRRIYIVENLPVESKTWYLQTEIDIQNKVWYLEGETNPFDENWFLQSELTNSIYNFTVYIPVIISFDETEIRRLLDNYVITNKSYNILTF